jgi:hypothetical protein
MTDRKQRRDRKNALHRANEQRRADRRHRRVQVDVDRLYAEVWK